MANYHPSENTLIEYAAGTLASPLSMCVAAHIELCPQCSHRLRQLNELGGSMLSSTLPTQVDPASFNALMSRIQAAPQQRGRTSTPTEARPTANTEHKTIAHLPKVVRKLIQPSMPVQWKRVSPSLKEAIITTGQTQFEVCFHKIKRGGKVAKHDHRGIEVTLVLEGSFSDEEGTYTVGDYIEKHPGEIHRPIATQNEDCLCLSVSEAPVKLTGWVGTLVNPFISFSPR